MPPGRSSGASREWGYESHAQAPHPLPLSERLTRTPLLERTDGNISPNTLACQHDFTTYNCNATKLGAILADQKIEKWAAMVGSWSFADDGAATFVAPEPNKRPFGLCVSNTRFSDGEIRLRISSDQPSEVDGRVLLGYHSPSNDYFVVGLGGYGKAYTLTHYNNLRGWTEIAGTGLSANLTPKKPYELCVRVSGKKITLEENDVEVISFELEQPIPYGQIGLFAWGAGGTKFENVRVKRDASSIEHVVILIHGIRTQADWQTMLHDEFSKAGIAVAPTNYGRFELFKFLFPIRSFTQPAIDRVWDLIRSVKRDYPNAKISFLAHSFGTHILTKILERDIDLKIHRIAFCGSVVRYDFPLQRYTQQFLPPIVNEVSANDPWPAIAEKLGFGYGSVGTRGFKSHYVEDRWHDGFGHSQYLTNIFCKTFWIPFFRDGNVVKSGNNPQPQKCWLRLLLLLTSKWTIATALILYGSFLNQFMQTKLRVSNFDLVMRKLGESSTFSPATQKTHFM